MINLWKELYEDTLFILPNTIYYSELKFKEFFIENKNRFLDYFNIIEKSYTENRYYHTLSHVKEVLDSLELFNNNITSEEKLLLRYAIWFHDIIYDPTNINNEKKSAELFIQFANSFGLSLNFGKDVYQLILSTEHKFKYLTRLEKIICDCDLKGFIENNYIERSNWVRKEFYHVNDEQWKDGRVRFLKYMLNKKHIYHTQKFRNLFEEKARINLKSELKYFKNDNQ